MANQILTHAGCVVFRREGTETVFLIASSTSKKGWILPKGKIDSDDKTIEDTALRELREEAGVEGKIIQPISIQAFTQHEKQVAVQYYLVEYTGETTPTEDRLIRWETAEKALDLITFDETRQAFLEAVDIVRRLS